MEREFYLISYDIGDEKRLQKVRKFLKDYGKAVQKSVFECWLTSEELERITAWLKDFIRSSEDRVRIYRLCRFCRQNVLYSGPDDNPLEEPPEELIL